MTALAVFAIVFLAIFTQSVTGFGLALVSMPLLAPLLGLGVAAPLVALFALVGEIGLLAYYRASLSLDALWKLVVAAFVGVPLGVWLLPRLGEGLALKILGIVVTGYALYALADLRLPTLEHAAWAYLFGLVAGVLGGAYNTSGPGVILYGHCRRWSPRRFKANLQGFFLATGVLILVSHAVAGNLTGVVWRYLLVALPAVALGMVAGLALDDRLDPVAFRRVTLVVLLVVGVRMVV